MFVSAGIYSFFFTLLGNLNIASLHSLAHSAIISYSYSVYCTVTQWLDRPLRFFTANYRALGSLIQ